MMTFKEQKSSKSAFGVSTTHAVISAAIRHVVKQILKFCLWKRIQYCLHAKPMFVFWSSRDTGLERDADQPNRRSTHYATYEMNKQAKEEVACVGQNRLLKQSLQNYPSERQLQWGLQGRKQLRTVSLHWCSRCYWNYHQIVKNWNFHDTKSHLRQYFRVLGHYVVW